MKRIDDTHYTFNVFRFNEPKTYLEALTEQSYCFEKFEKKDFPFEYLFRPMHDISPTQLVMNNRVKAFEFADGRKLFDEQDFLKSANKYFTSSVLETTLYIFWVGAFFRGLEVIGYRLKHELLKNTSKNMRQQCT